MSTYVCCLLFFPWRTCPPVSIPRNYGDSCHHALSLMPGGFLQCQSDLTHRAHILLQVFFFHLEESHHPKGTAIEKTISRPSSASSLHQAEAEVPCLFSVSWKRPTGTWRHSPPPPHANISNVWWHTQHFTWVTTVFKRLFLPFFSQTHRKQTCRKPKLMAGDWPLGWPLYDSTLGST